MAGVIDLRLGRYQEALADVKMCDAVITDPPYSKRTHEAKVERVDGKEAAGLTPEYAAWGEAEVFEFARSWGPRCRGWIVALCDSDLIPVYRAAYESVGRYAFAPVPCVMRGMSFRQLCDGPSSWAVYAMVSRPKGREWVGMWTQPGAYTGSPGAEASGGRGKPEWLISALVRDYSLPYQFGAGADVTRTSLIVDPCAGWGGTLHAAAALGRDAIGAEVDDKAYARASEMIKRPLQRDLFA